MGECFQKRNCQIMGRIEQTGENREQITDQNVLRKSSTRGGVASQPVVVVDSNSSHPLSPADAGNRREKIGGKKGCGIHIADHGVKQG